jgi:hypothetical protein
MAYSDPFGTICFYFSDIYENLGMIRVDVEYFQVGDEGFTIRTIALIGKLHQGIVDQPGREFVQHACQQESRIDRRFKLIFKLQCLSAEAERRIGIAVLLFQLCLVQ